MSAQRILPSNVSPEIYKTLVKYDTQIYTESSLDKELIELIKIKVSQLNGCAFCIDMHSKQALALGASNRKLLLLNAFEEASLFSQEEKAALKWAEGLTFIKGIGAKEQYYQALKEYFSDKEIVDLTYLIGLINVWNRLAISMIYDVA